MGFAAAYNKDAQPVRCSDRRPAGQLDGSGNLSATVVADRAFPAAVAELGSLGGWHPRRAYAL